MGYRDDAAALESQRDIIQREVEELSGEHAEASAIGEKLRREVKKKRLRIRLMRIWRWISRHPKTVVFLLLVVGIGSYVRVRIYLDERERAAAVERVLGTGCETRLKISASPRSRLFVDALFVGRTPVDVPICRGSYLLRLAHRRALPWQRRIQIVDRDVEIKAGLIPFSPGERIKNGTLFVTDPPGALLFVNGKELGVTPVFARWQLLGSSGEARPWAVKGAVPGGALSTLRIGAWSPGRRPLTWLVRRKPTIWLQLGHEGYRQSPKTPHREAVVSP